MSTKTFRLIGTFLILVMLTGVLSACQPAATPAPTEAAAKPEKIAALFMGPVTDQSWNQMGFEGIKKAKEDCGIDYAYTENVKQTEFEETMRNYAQQDFTTIIGHSGTFTEAGKKIAGEFPNTKFIVVNAITGNGTNQSGIYSDYWQMGYLAGSRGLPDDKNQQGCHRDCRALPDG